MKNLLRGTRRFVTDETAVSSVHYGLLLALIGVAIILTALGLGQAITDRIDSTANIVQTGTVPGSGAGSGSGSTG